MTGATLVADHTHSVWYQVWHDGCLRIALTVNDDCRPKTTGGFRKLLAHILHPGRVEAISRAEALGEIDS